MKTGTKFKTCSRNSHYFQFGAASGASIFSYYYYKISFLPQLCTLGLDKVGVGVTVSISFRVYLLVLLWDGTWFPSFNSFCLQSGRWISSHHLQTCLRIPLVWLPATSWMHFVWISRAVIHVAAQLQMTNSLSAWVQIQGILGYTHILYPWIRPIKCILCCLNIVYNIGRVVAYMRPHELISLLALPAIWLTPFLLTYCMWRRTAVKPITFTHASILVCNSLFSQFNGNTSQYGSEVGRNFHFMPDLIMSLLIFQEQKWKELLLLFFVDLQQTNKKPLTFKNQVS